MLKIPNYRVTEKIYESNKSLIYQGYRVNDSVPVILKMLKGDYPSPSELKLYRQAYEITSPLNLPNVVKTYALEKYQNTLIMVLEDFGGKPLSHPTVEAYFAQLGAEKIIGLLRLFVQMVESIEAIHSARIIHKDINPSNILFNPTTHVLKITDFGISERLSPESLALKSPTKLEGTLAYMPPEQTGRIDSFLDFRADFYALGVTFYTLLTRRLPFESTDAMELVHCHLARLPEPPALINPDVPNTLSEMVLKLLEKTPEARYQSAYGLKTDLEICLRELQARGTIQPFSLGQHDVSNRFQLPHKLYGRTQETEKLLAIFDRICGTNTETSAINREMVLIIGYTGIGKTALVREMFKPLVYRRSYFTAGEFEQLQRNVPFYAIIKALTHLVEQLLTESETQLAQWRITLTDALGINAAIITDVIPEIEFIIGKQLPALDVPSMESRNRFNLVFHNFVKTLARPEHPLILFLDNLQWADTASLHLFRQMASDIPYLLLIGTYRDEEIGIHHPLQTVIKKIEEKGVIVHTLRLSPLTLPDTVQLITDTLHCSSTTAVPLAELTLSKTQGNPFFVKEFLKSLYREGLLYFHQYQWHWKIKEIYQLEITANVVELLTKKVRQLSEKSQQILQFAACVGHCFSIDTLGTITKNIGEDLKSALQEALLAELILPLEGGLTVPVESHETRYMFVHERIHQVVYALLPEEPKYKVHQQVGQLLLNKTPPEKHLEHIFDIVNQLNLGSTCFREQSQRDELARLNLLAGQKAKTSTAYELALDYFLTGICLLGEHRWKTHYSLTLELTEEVVEASFLCTQFERMECLVEEALPAIQSFLDTIKIQEIRMQAYKAQNQLAQAVDLGLSLLATLGIKFPASPTHVDILYASLHIKRYLFGKSVQSLSCLPAMTDPNKIAAMQIMLSISPAVYAIKPKLLPLVTFKRVELSIRYGNTLESIPTYASYGYLLCEKNIEQGYQFGQLALQLLAQKETDILKARVFQIVYGVINHNKEHIGATLQPLTEAYQTGIDTGNFEYAAFSALTHLVHAYFVGKELNVLEREMSRYTESLIQLKQQSFLPILQVYHQTALNLLNQSKTTIYLVGETYNEEKMLPIHQQTNEKGIIFRVYFQKMILCYLFGAYPEALDNALKAEHYLDSVIGSLLIPFFYFYSALISLAVFATASDKIEKKTIRQKVMKQQRKLKKWARHAPMNYLHKFYLIEAELARILRRHCYASELYDRAIALARKNEYVNEEALALELAAKFYLSRKQPRIAQIYLRDAHHAYNRWGAVAKVKALEAEYPHLLIHWEDTFPKQSLTSTSTSTINESVTSLDLTSVLKASQVLAKEIVLKQLLEKLMRIVIENVGAQKGLLLLKEQNHWIVEVKTVVDSVQVKTLHIPFEESEDLSTGVVQYVARTKMYLLLNEGEKTEQFSKDPYMLKHNPKSTLCLPLIYQGHLSSILYLENRSTAHVFTPTRLEMLRLLSSQMAISIENAHLYAGLEEKVRERTQDLEQKNQELTRLNERLVDLNREKDEFLGIAAHDLKNPLAGIQGLADLIATDMYSMTQEEMLDIIKMISMGAKQMFELIKNLLDVNVIETGRLSLNLQTFNIMAILSYLVNQYQERAKLKQINLHFQHTQEQYFIFADESIVRQVLDNLISNAIKYAPSDTHVYISVEQNETHVRCAVRDEGPGLSEKDKKNLFKKFSRLTPQPTGNEHSTGLGLFIVHKLIKIMNGRVWCESELGQGSTFFVEFPSTSSMDNF